jgi:glycosyltransferase involved in cell wall biosynthesis
MSQQNDNLSSGGISLVIPVYNEADNIQKAVQDGLKVLPGLDSDFEIIIIESGSTDDTGAVTDRLAAANDRVKVIHQGAKLGLGSALKAGFGAARYASIFYIDGDNPFRMEEFARGFPLLREADIVCGYRTNRQDTAVRALYSKAFNLLMRVLFGVKARDTQIGFKLLRKSVFERVQLTTDSMFIDAELLIKAQKAGYRIAELGVEYLGKPSGKSSVTFREVVKIGADLIKYRFGGLK